MVKHTGGGWEGRGGAGWKQGIGDEIRLAGEGWEIYSFSRDSGFCLWIGAQNQRTMTESRVCSPDQPKFPRLDAELARLNQQAPTEVHPSRPPERCWRVLLKMLGRYIPLCKGGNRGPVGGEGTWLEKIESPSL